ncbi:MAG: hypothetical protein HQL45_14240 [Alphaproteobacteria bacterium]|nr:hypothetical protein [Alphaproteobacteria bacterium]
MSTFAQSLAESRRLFTLRLLVEGGGSVNESVLFKHARRGGFPLTTEDDLKADLRKMEKHGLIRDEWLNENVRVIHITTRGTDCAYGRLEIEGIEQSIWDRD